LAVNDTSVWNRLIRKAILEAAGQKADQNVLEAALADNKAIDTRFFLGGKKQESAKAEDA
jgi:hypothetical protein